MSLQQFFESVISVITQLFDKLSSGIGDIFESIWTAEIYYQSGNEVEFLVCVSLLVACYFYYKYLDKILHKILPDIPDREHDVTFDWEIDEKEEDQNESKPKHYYQLDDEQTKNYDYIEKLMGICSLVGIGSVLYGLYMVLTTTPPN